MDEQRKFPRTLVLSGGSISFHAAATRIDCVVRDISEGGARLLLAVAGIPSEFKLALDGHPMRHCFVKWRKSNQLGVAFIPAESATIEP